MSMARLLATVAIVVVCGTAGFLLFRAWSKNRTGPLVPGAAATIMGVGIFAESYLWLFDISDCNGRGDITCALNENQGLLTFLAVIIAVLTIWITVLANESNRRAVMRVENEELRTTLLGAVDEAIHNLMHLALCYNEQRTRFESLPQLSTFSVAELSSRNFRRSVASGVIRYADLMLRNYARIENANRMPDLILETDATERRQHYMHHLQRPLYGFIAHSFHFLSWSLAEYEEWTRHVFQAPGLQDFQEIKQRAERKRDSDSSALIRYWYYDLTSEAASRAANIRAGEEPLICWFKDKDIEGVEPFVLFNRFSDLADLRTH
jgi:hypothetical protein